VEKCRVATCVDNNGPHTMHATSIERSRSIYYNNNNNDNNNSVTARPKLRVTEYGVNRAFGTSLAIVDNVSIIVARLMARLLFCSL